MSMTDPINVPVNVGPPTETDPYALTAPSDAPPSDAPPPDAPPPDAPPVPTALDSMIAQLSAQLASSPQFAEAMRVAARDAGTVPLRQRALPAVHELVSYTHISNRSGLPHVQRGIVLAVDPEGRTAHVVWLPDGEAMMPVDQLDDPPPAS